MIIDIHAHTSVKKLFGLHTTDASIEHLECLAKKYGIEKIVLLATCFPFKGTGLTNLDLLNRIKSKDLFLAFGTVDASWEKIYCKELTELLTKRLIRGIKLYPGYQVFDPVEAKMKTIYELAEQFNVPVMFHTGELHHCCPKSSRQQNKFRCGATKCLIDQYSGLAKPKNMLKVAMNFPRVKFILSHLGNPFFEQLIEVMQRVDNVYTDISGQFVSGTAEDSKDYRKFIIKKIIKVLQLKNGEQRLMFGTDFPIQSYEDSIWLVENLPVDDDLKQKIYWQNANQVLRLGLNQGEQE